MGQGGYSGPAPVDSDPNMQVGETQAGDRTRGRRCSPKGSRPLVLSMLSVCVGGQGGRKKGQGDLGAVRGKLGPPLSPNLLCGLRGASLEPQLLLRKSQGFSEPSACGGP